jgi:hypothetical protein
MYIECNFEAYLCNHRRNKNTANIKYTDLLIYCMEESPFGEANQFSASQEIPRIL